MLADRVTANDRFKASNESRTWGAIAAAALVHFAVLALWPAATPDVLGAEEAAETAILAPPEVPIPPPPAEVARPSTPVITVDAPDDVTIPPTAGPESVALPPPPVREGTRDIQPGDIVPVTVRPSLQNGDRIAAELRRRYPRTLHDAGIEATVLLWVKVDDSGRAMEARVKESSGYAAFDDLALDLAPSMAFRPALNMDRAVVVWTQIPVAFRIR